MSQFCATVVFAQLKRASLQGNQQAQLELGASFIWGNRSLVPDNCYTEVGLNGTAAAVPLLVAAVGTPPFPMRVNHSSSPLLRTQALALEYIVLAQLSRLEGAEFFKSDVLALQALVPIAFNADAASPHDGVISQAVIAYHKYVGLILPADCMGAQALFLRLAQAAVSDVERTGSPGTDDILLFDIWDDMESAQLIQEQPMLVDYYRQFADEGDVDAMLALGGALLHGDPGAGLQRDPAGAAMWMNRAAQAGVPEAHAYLGMMSVYGIGTETNYSAALNNYSLAAAAGVADAYVGLGYVSHCPLCLRACFQHSMCAVI